jgi:hypothetical protein
LKNDCCSCEAMPVSEPVEPCPGKCSAAVCAITGGVQGPWCEAGQCIVGFDCTSPVYCNALPPNCPPGRVPAVLGGCWGGCVPVEQCTAVPSCDRCRQAGYLCVSDVARWMNLFHCVPVPSTCSGNLTCACAGSILCGAPPTFQCAEGGADNADFSCSCPSC